MIVGDIKFPIAQSLQILPTIARIKVVLNFRTWWSLTQAFKRATCTSLLKSVKPLIVYGLGIVYATSVQGLQTILVYFVPVP